MNGFRTLDGSAPKIIAHRGASGEYPEHVIAGYRAALAQGADIIEPDLVMSRDARLICRHDLGLARSTDIAGRAAFAGRAREGDWWCWDFDAEEISGLGALQPFPLREQGYNGRFPPPTFAQMIEWAAGEAASRGRPVVLYPELKHPLELAERGLDPVPPFMEAARSLPEGVELLVQCFEPVTLRRVVDATGLPGMLLVDSSGDPQAALEAHGSWLSGLALSRRLLLAGEGQGEALVAALHARGLTVDAWTIRDDQPLTGFASAAEEVAALARMGVDRLFCDYPASAVRVIRTMSTASV
ncbi:glycerophosphodiester phosphodiesterase family protein [Pseudomarimonas salicorniae]|uniref:glycerophosphodiester phosphodiesterase n=1 Tax=Pseudomarimonas salicorniae TaxID=2933270 RepID=A0ABT0GMG0_9GAMM|nr:glycerophosphodiester phosphodiesterase family protein [Lysobacter sp. CAU 1642]MCK7595409.1 hypothetical protein [Lysobacter sp. CAU 1642]